MLKVGIIGLGFMGKTHLENYLRLEKEGVRLKVTALCDIDPLKLQGRGAAGNIDTASEPIDFSRFQAYESVGEMLEHERLDCVSIALPSYLHKEATVRCLNRGIHVLCEKPMAMNAEDCAAMIEAAGSNGRQLLIGQCLRFWPAYVYLKELVESGTYGEVRGGHFYRGGGTPTWGAWLTRKEQSGGAMLDMHVHDTDMVRWLFGKPEAVSSHARNVVPGSGYDIVSTHYRYGDGKVVNAQADWTLEGDYGFEMSYRVNFERGNAVFQDGILKVNPTGAPGFVPELSAEMGYYFELKYFIDTIQEGGTIEIAEPSSTMGSIEIVEAEIASADRGGAWVQVK